MKIVEHMGILGHEVEDRVTGATGVASSVSFDLYGCIQVVVTPKVDKDGKTGDSKWYDISRLKVLTSAPVMSVPNYEHGDIAEGRKGPAEKPPLDC